jgi:hypothetical protein
LSTTQNVNTFADLVSTFLIHSLRRPRISAIANAQRSAKKGDFGLNQCSIFLVILKFIKFKVDLGK